MGMLDEESRCVVTYILMCVYERPVLRENYSVIGILFYCITIL